MDRKSKYGDSFYDWLEVVSRNSAEAMVPKIVELLQPKSVIDVGCGRGLWLDEFARAGVTDCYGVDGSWVDPSRFALGLPRFIEFDFIKETPPFRPRLPRDRFDLVVTLEFLEHVRSDLAPALVEFLASLGDTIVMSAAIPGQGGTEHVNEKWIDYWGNLFKPFGFVAFDFLRPLFWDDDRIDPCYRQNAIGLFRGPLPQKVVIAAEEAALARLRAPTRLVHPGTFAYYTDPWQLPRSIVKRVIGPRLAHHLRNTISSSGPKTRGRRIN